MAYKLTCPVCFYSTHLVGRHGRFRGVEAELERCPACNAWVVPIVSKRDLADSSDYNVLKKW